jgi:hypothetical protein
MILFQLNPCGHSPYVTSSLTRVGVPLSPAGLRFSLYSLGSDPTENTVSIVIAQQYFYCCLRNPCRGNLFTESLPSKGRLLWLRYSGVQASCHTTKIRKRNIQTISVTYNSNWTDPKIESDTTIQASVNKQVLSLEANISCYKRNFATFMKAEDSLPCSQEPVYVRKKIVIMISVPESSTNVLLWRSRLLFSFIC